MTSIKVEIKAELTSPAHAMATVWAGPSPEYRAHCGTLTMTPDEAAELIGRVNAGERGPGAITPEIAQHVLWAFHADSGVEPPPFARWLLTEIVHADAAMRKVIAEGHPTYVAACEQAWEDPDGFGVLEKIAAGEA